MKSQTDKISVLLFIDWFLPGDKAGGPVRSCANLIDHLGSEFNFSVVTRDTDYTDEKPLPGIKSNAWNVLPDGKRVYYISSDQLNKSIIAKLLREEIYDVVYLNGIWSQPFTAWPLKELKKQNKKVRKVVAARGMLAPSALAIKAVKKKLFLKLAKWRNYFGDVVFHATTEKEAEEIKKSFGKNCKVLVAGNLPRKSVHLNNRRTKIIGQLKIISVARIAPEKNTLYAIEILSKIKSSVTADFFGSIYDEKYWNECREMSKRLPSNVQLNFHGALPSEQIFSTVSEYDIMFMPTRGENFGHIILESLQAGTPVLISDQTPWKNLEQEKAGWDISLQSPADYVKIIERIAEMNEEEFSKWTAGTLKLGMKYAEDPKLIEENRKLFLD